MKSSPKLWFGIGTGITTIAAIVMMVWWLGGDPHHATASSSKPDVPQPLPTQPSSQSPAPRLTPEQNPYQNQHRTQNDLAIERTDPVELYREVKSKIRSHDLLEAARLLRRHNSLPSISGSFTKSQLAILDLYAGNLEEHRQDAQEMMDLFGQSNGPDDAERAVKACVLSRTPILIEKAKTLSRKILVPKGQDPDSGFWYDTIVALVAIRSGELEQALTILEETRPTTDPKQPASLCMIDALISIAHARLGHVEKAKDALTKSINLFNEKTFDGKNIFTTGDSWHDWMVCQILRQEAESLLNISSN